MFMQNIYKNITGYVKFYGKGTFPERFLNLCAKDNVDVWNLKVDVNELYGSMHINDYKNIRKNAKKSCMKFKIIKRVGLPFVINRYRYRYGIVVGAVMFVFLLWYLSGFCFNITVNGNEKFKESEVIERLYDSGVYLGQRMNRIDADTARQSFLINNPEFSWAAVNIKGTYITVDVVETVNKKMENTDTYPCNIVAKTDGKILKVKAYEGKTSVKIGEAVTKGDLLVSGVVELTNKTTKFVHANAEVLAQTRHELEVFVPFKTKQKLVDDEITEHSVLTVINKDIPLFLGGVEKPYVAKKTVKKYKMLGVELPIKKTTAYFKKIKYKNINLSKQSAKQLAEEKVKQKAKKELKDTIKSEEKGEFFVTENGVFYKKVFICEENIAIDIKILK